MKTEQEDIFGDDIGGNDLLQAVATLDDHHWPYRLTEMVEVMAAAALRQGMAADQAEALRLAHWAVLVVADHFGGRQTYLPRGDSLRRALRDNHIWHEFNGRNVDELGSKYKMSAVRIYSILAEQRALHRAKVQPQLPFPEQNNDERPGI